MNIQKSLKAIDDLIDNIDEKSELDTALADEHMSQKTYDELNNRDKEGLK